MAKQKKKSDSKARLHFRSLHKEPYNFENLASAHPELKQFVRPSKYQKLSIDFADPIAVKALNTAILKSFYRIENWDIPEGYLTPPIPGRADYIHHIADVLYRDIQPIQKVSDVQKIEINCLDIGVGANCIYPILGRSIYNWKSVGTDVDPTAVESAKNIVASNPSLKEAIEIREQKDPTKLFEGVVEPTDFFDISICNPPFHASAEEAREGSIRKIKNLTGEKVEAPVLNFGGQSNELWCEGGEEIFIKNMIEQSKQFGNNIMWFSTLVSRRSIVNKMVETIKANGAFELKTIPMGQGNKTSRMLVWTFLTKQQQERWQKARWAGKH